MLAQKKQYIESAYERLRVISQGRAKRMEYEAREKAILDYNQMVLEAEERGQEQINRLNALLIKENRFEDLERSMVDKVFQQLLISDYVI